MRFVQIVVIWVFSLGLGMPYVLAQSTARKAVAPTDEIIKLQAELDEATADSSKFRILLALQQASNKPFYTDYLKTYSLKLAQIAESRPDHLFKAHYYLTLVYWRFKNTDSAFKHIQICDSITENLDKLEYIVNTKQLLGVIYSAYDDLELTQKNMEEVIKLAPELGPSFQGKIIHAYNVLGNQSFIHGNLVKASRYYLGMLEAAEGFPQKEPHLSAAINLANVHLELGHLDQVFAYSDEAMCMSYAQKDTKRLARSYKLMGEAWRQRGNLDWAESYAQKSLSYGLALDRQYTLLSSCYQLLGLIAHDKEDFRKATAYQKEALHSLSFYYGRPVYLSDKETQSQLFMELGVSYRKLNQMDLALLYLDSAFAVNLEVKNAKHLAEIHRNYAITFARKGDYKQAYEHEVQAVKNEKASSSELNRQVVEDIQLQYESLKKDQLISQLETEKLKEEAKRAKNLNQRNYLIISLLFSTFLFSLFIYYLQQRRKKEKIIGQQQLELQNLKINDLLNEQAANSMSALLEGQEKERKRVAIDLHDRMGSLLAMAKLHLTEGSDLALPLVESAITEVRKISHNLASGTLNDFGLLVALAELKKMVEESGKVSFTLHTFKIDRRFPTHIEINLYRIIQELINNSLKHAEATKINLSLTRREDALSMVYEDNGIGFDIQQAQQETGMGLGNMKNRAAQLSGELHINTKPGLGMEALLEIPLHEQKTL